MPAFLVLRRRLLATAVLVLTVGGLTACEDGEGIRDEGPAAAFVTHPHQQNQQDQQDQQN
ncbi:hypothetical protein [Streptomyces tsukubensis]|uniref:Secreted protein n=1 Tax=Streptomyces tsukubensis TaxID=83656 RepID=A0A1V4A8D4_9ACTN|nr:hypothetical protein [Streptomyces tsukubensis]OON78353.1 hypothetical protein B1H18_16275 [Streptomyces tsukubensis]QFR95114.1 hypothetical protein GBW32_21435 [Streptomyces tsukubensis]